MSWISFAFKYGPRCAFFYWREVRRPANRPKLVFGPEGDADG